MNNFCSIINDYLKEFGNTYLTDQEIDIVENIINFDSNYTLTYKRLHYEIHKTESVSDQQIDALKSAFHRIKQKFQTAFAKDPFFQNTELTLHNSRRIFKQIINRNHSRIIEKAIEYINIVNDFLDDNPSISLSMVCIDHLDKAIERLQTHTDRLR